MLLVAVLTVRAAQRGAFRDYEHAAARIMARHGGAIERAVELPGLQPDNFRELHLVRFPDTDAFAAYRADPALAALGPLREAVVVSTEIWPGLDGPRYGEPPA